MFNRSPLGTTILKVMLSNHSVIVEFFNGRAAKSGSMRSTGRALYSYATKIAEWSADGIIANVTKYSVTTSRQQTEFKRVCSPMICKEVSGIGFAQSWGDQY